MKHLKWIIPLLIIAVIWSYFQFNQTSSVDGLGLIPDDALYIIETDKPIASWNTFTNSDIWTIFKTHPSFIDLANEASYLDSLITNNTLLFNWFDNRSFFISAHLTQVKDYDFLYVIGLSNKAKPEVVLTGLAQLLKLSGYHTTETRIENVRVLSAKDELGESIHFGQIGNQLICSYSKMILTKSIQASSSNSIRDKNAFLEVYDKVSRNGLCRLYFTYAMAEDLMKCYFDRGLDVMRDIGELLGVSALDFETGKDYWTLDGFTNVDSLNKSFLNAVLESGQSNNTVGDVLSNRTAWYLSLNYSNFNDFQNNLESNLQLSDQIAPYQKRQKQIETLLGISVETDLLSWIGDELTIAQLRKNLSYDESENAVLLIKADDISIAKERLTFVAQQVKKRTPAKFVQIDYRSYQIQYLEIKGFFKLLFGETFNKITKPYYTIIDNYVVFSNSPYTLIGLIEDFENQRNLSETAYYKRYKSEANKNSISLFVSPVNLYPALLPMLNQSNSNAMRVNKPYFDAFESIGLELVSNDGIFNTHLMVIQKSVAAPIEQVNETEFDKLYKLYASERDINSAQFVLEWIENGIYRKQFPGSQEIQIVSETSNGVLDGDYEEFYLNGKTRTTGKYKKGRKKGTWKLYDESGELIEKKKY